MNACATTGELRAKRVPDVLQHRVLGWLGTSREFLEKHWGLAQKTQDMGNGLRFLEYKSKKKTPQLCSVTFTVDITQRVLGGQWTGDREACLNFVKEVPQVAPRQDLVMTP